MGNMKERELLKAVYKKSKTWATRVNNMTDAQVLAIYFKFRNQNKV